MFPHTSDLPRRRLLELLAVTAATWHITGPVVLPPAHAATAPAGAPTAAPAQLRIGFQKAAINLLVLRATGALERRLPATRIDWQEFSAGPPLLEAMAAGTVDFGLVGDTPPVFAQAAGKDLLYIGAEPPQPDSIAVLVPWRSRIRDVQGLQGRRVAVQTGSGAHYLLLRVLAQAGLGWGDIRPVDLPPAQARAAFDSGQVDAWAIWDPFYAATELEAGPRVLATAHGLSGGHAFYLSTRALARAHPGSIGILFEELARADRLVQERRLDAVRLIAEATALPPAVVTQLLRRRTPSPATPVSPPALAAQQRLADAFWEHGLLPRPLRVADALWHGAAAPATTLAGG